MNEYDYSSLFAQQKTQDELSKWQLSGEELLELFKHDLRNETWNPTGGEDGSGAWESPPGVKPFMNEQGIYATVSLMRNAAINKHTLLSNIPVERIYFILREVSNDLSKLYFKEHNNFDIRSEDHASYIISQVFFFMESVLLSAKDGGFRDYLKMQVREVHQITDTKRSDKRGLFSGLFGKKGDKSDS